MRKATKWLLRALGVLMLGAVLAVAGAWVWFDRVVKAALVRGVENVGEAPCTVEKVRASLLSGKVRLEGLCVRNPKGYPDACMLTVEDIRIELEVGSLRHGPVRVRSLRILRPSIRVEGGPDGSNVRTFLETAKRNLAAQSGGGQTRLIIDWLRIEDAAVHVASGVSNRGLMDINLSSIELTNLRGRDGQGVTAGELAATLMVEMLHQAAIEGQLDFRNLIPPELARGLGTVLQSASSLIESTTGLLTSPLSVLLHSASRPGLFSGTGSR